MPEKLTAEERAYILCVNKHLHENVREFEAVCSTCRRGYTQIHEAERTYPDRADDCN